MNSNEREKFSGGRVLGGLIIVGVGSALLAKQVGADFPRWFFSWPMGLIVLGIYIGARHRFRNIGWLFPFGVGMVFLLDQMIPDLDFGHFAWPIFIIIAGVAMIFKRTRHDKMFRKWEEQSITSSSSEGVMDSVVIFGENKKQILSKDFRGGESVCIFGGAELNLTQADINGRVVLELTQVFGGTKLIVPPHWKIESDEMVSIFGGINDKRQFNNVAIDQSKTIVLRGTTIFGGIDIKSF